MTILAVGQIKDRWLKEAIDDFRKRLTPYCDVAIQEVADSSDRLPLKDALRQEAERLARKLPAKGQVVLLDLGGKMYDSPALADCVATWFERGQSQIVFVIAGSNGFDPDFRSRFTERLALSPLTFTHMLTRLLLLEQVYRAFKIQRNEPYHK